MSNRGYQPKCKGTGMPPRDPSGFEKQTVKLINWRIEKHPVGVYVLRGETIGHPRFKDWTTVRTSELLNIDFKNSIAETKNTIYILESEEGL